MKLSALALLVSLLGTAASLVACAPENGLSGSSGGGEDDGDGSGAGPGSGGAGQGGSSGNGFGSGVGGGGLEECASEAIEAELAPLTMFFAYDKSGSMSDNNKWNNARNAMKAFVADPTAAGLEVALRFFPKDQCNESACNIAACATPDVNVAALTADTAPTDVQEALFSSALDVTSPGGATPMSAALEGAIEWSTQYLGTHPDHKVVVILVTDGEPNGCQESIGAIANIAAGGLVQDVITYTVGLEGSNEAQLQQIATAGGGSSFFIGNGNAQADLLAALQAIRGEQLACEIPIPEPTMGEFNPTLVNVTYTPGDGSAEKTLGNVANEGACTANGWYYDDPANPQTIVLCPSACDLVKADEAGKIEVVLGCQTIPG